MHCHEIPLKPLAAEVIIYSEISQDRNNSFDHCVGIGLFADRAAGRKT
jgi:hypothetical protein